MNLGVSDGTIHAGVAPIILRDSEPCDPPSGLDPVCYVEFGGGTVVISVLGLRLLRLLLLLSLSSCFLRLFFFFFCQLFCWWLYMMLFLLLLLSSSKEQKMKLATQQKKQQDILLQYVSIAQDRIYSNYCRRKAQELLMPKHHKSHKSYKSQTSRLYMSTKVYLFVQGTRSLVARGRDASLMTFWVEAHEKMQEKSQDQHWKTIGA